jgi:hypothetical protein
MKGFIVVAPGGIELPTQGFSGLMFLLERIKISTSFPLKSAEKLFFIDVPKQKVEFECTKNVGF